MQEKELQFDECEYSDLMDIHSEDEVLEDEKSGYHLVNNTTNIFDWRL